MPMQIDTQAMEHYLRYQGKKYIAPEKAGERKAEMAEYKLAGQAARKAFQELSKGVCERLDHFDMQKVSGWMNQAQIGRPHFWCYFYHEGDTRVDPTFAIRLLTLEDRLAISVEVSFIERGLVPGTLERQNQVLEVPASDSMYYLVQVDGESHRHPGTEAVRQGLREKREAGSLRKVLVKYDILHLTDFASDQDLIDALLEGFRILSPYYEAT